MFVDDSRNWEVFGNDAETNGRSALYTLVTGNFLCSSGLPIGRPGFIPQRKLSMPRSRHYSPVIERFLVAVLYHEARHRKMPMTRLTNQLLREALSNSVGWQTATHLTVLPPVCPAGK